MVLADVLDELDLPGYHPLTFGDPVLIGQAVELIAQARRPVSTWAAAC